MRLEAVTVCLNYDDFLEPAIRANQALFEDWVVVTEAGDKGTHDVCERYGVRAIDCPYFTKGGSHFDKARGINLGLAHLSCSDWMLHIDADIVLPQDTRQQLLNIDLDPLNIYGMDRVDCPTYEDYAKYLIQSESWKKSYFVSAPSNWHRGTRLRHFDFGGYAPIGYFQLWNRASGVTRYPMVHDANAEHCDVLHSLQWPRIRRVLIPELLAIHLATGGPNMGLNWKGRKTPRFGPATINPGAEHSKKYCATC